MADILHPASRAVARALYEKQHHNKEFIAAADHVAEWWCKLGDAAIRAYLQHEAGRYQSAKGRP